jgi:hypothetical protein
MWIPASFWHSGKIKDFSSTADKKFEDLAYPEGGRYEN